MFRTFIAGGLALAVSMMAAGAASAMEASCLWDNLSTAKRTELLANYRATGVASLDKLPLVDADLEGWSTRCGVTEANAETAGMLLGSVLMERGTVEALTRAYGVTPAAVAQAWKDVDAATKAAARKDAALALEDKETEGAGAGAALFQMIQTLKLPEAATEQVALYIFAVLARDIVES